MSIEDKPVMPLGMNIIATDKYGVCELSLIAIVGSRVEKIRLKKENNHENPDTFNNPMLNSIEPRRTSFYWTVKGYVEDSEYCNRHEILCEAGKVKRHHFTFRYKHVPIKISNLILNLCEDIESLHSLLVPDKLYNPSPVQIFITVEAEKITKEEKIPTRTKNNQIFVHPTQESFVVNYYDRALNKFKVWYER